MDGTKKITEGAMMCTIVCLFLLLNRQLGNMLEYAIYWVLSFPILIYTAKYGVKSAILPSVCMLLLSFMLGSFTTVFYLFSSILVGLVYGGGVRKNWKNGNLLLCTVIFTFFSYLITTVLFASLFGYDISEDIQIVEKILELAHMQDANAIELVPIFLLLFAVLMSFLQALCIHMISNVLLPRLQISVRKMKNPIEIKAPVWIGVVILVIWVLFYSRNVLKLNHEVSSILLVLYVISKVFTFGYGAVYILMRMAIKKKHSKLYVLIFIICALFLNSIISLIGAGDILFRFRDKLRRGVSNGSFRKF